MEESDTRKIEAVATQIADRADHSMVEVNDLKMALKEWADLNVGVMNAVNPTTSRVLSQALDAAFKEVVRQTLMALYSCGYEIADAGVKERERNAAIGSAEFSSVLDDMAEKPDCGVESW